MIETIKDALKKKPDAKYIWMHPDDAKEAGDSINQLGLKVSVSYMMEKGVFVLSEKEMDESLSLDNKSLYF